MRRIYRNYPECSAFNVYVRLELQVLERVNINILIFYRMSQ